MFERSAVKDSEKQMYPHCLLERNKCIHTEYLGETNVSMLYTWEKQMYPRCLLGRNKCIHAAYLFLASFLLSCSVQDFLPREWCHLQLIFLRPSTVKTVSHRHNHGQAWSGQFPYPGSSLKESPEIASWQLKVAIMWGEIQLGLGHPSGVPHMAEASKGLMTGSLKVPKWQETPS